MNMKMNWVLVDSTKPGDFVVAKQCAEILLRNGNYNMRKDVSADVRDYCLSYEIEECEFVLHVRLCEVDVVSEIGYGEFPGTGRAKDELENMFEHSDAAYKIEYHKDESDDWIPMAWTRIDG